MLYAKADDVTNPNIIDVGMVDTSGIQHNRPRRGGDRHPGGRRLVRDNLSNLTDAAGDLDARNCDGLRAVPGARAPGSSTPTLN